MIILGVYDVLSGFLFYMLDFSLKIAEGLVYILPRFSSLLQIIRSYVVTFSVSSLFKNFCTMQEIANLLHEMRSKLFIYVLFSQKEKYQHNQRFTGKINDLSELRGDSYLWYRLWCAFFGVFFFASRNHPLPLCITIFYWNYWSADINW